MATYKGIQGFTIQNLSQDPVPAIAGWSAGGNYPVTVNTMSGAAGTPTAGLGFGGYVSSPPGSTQSAEYDGSTWTTAPNLANKLQFRAGAGAQTSALAVQGEGTIQSNATEEYDGSTWTAGGAFPATGNGGAGNGTQTAAVVVTGSNAGEYDGSTWTASGTLANPRTYAISGGLSAPQSAAWIAGGYVSPATATEFYDGTTWTAQAGTTLYPTAQGAGAGSQTTGIQMGGSSPGATNGAKASSFDGTSWSALSDMTTSRSGGPGGFGSNTQAVVFGAGTPLTATEEYNDYSPYAGQTVQNEGQVWYNNTENVWKVQERLTTGAWSSSANYPTPLRSGAASGTPTAGVYATGYDGTANITNTNEYDGSAWTAGNPVNTARRATISSTGTQTSVVMTAGFTTAATNATEEYDGTSWTTTGNLPYSGYSVAASGTGSAGLAWGGSVATPPGRTDSTNEYNGATWTAGGSLPSRWSSAGGAGTQTATISISGENDAVPGPTPATLSYDGSTWSTLGASLNQSRLDSAVGGSTQTAALAVGGGNPSPPTGTLNTTETYDGISWSVQGNYPTTITAARGAGSSSAAFVVGGQDPAVTNAVNEYTPEGPFVTKTITTS